MADVAKGDTVTLIGDAIPLAENPAITVTGGSLYAYSSSDDAINCQGEMNVTGGYVYGHSTGTTALTPTET